jgi:hypothetical protein
MINFTMDEIKILIGHIEMEKYDLKLKLDKAVKTIEELIEDNQKLKKQIQETIHG